MSLPKTGTIEIAPSILSADFGKLADDIAEIETAGIKIVHLDIMDGHFVPNISFGPPVVTSLRKRTRLVFDTHLMITDPEKYAPVFAKAGSDHITFHIEVCENPTEIVKQLRDLGVSVGVSLNPETPVKSIEKVAPLCDMILVMTVHPGFGGQSFIAEAADKIPDIRKIVGPEIRIEVDGGMNPETAGIVVAKGADTIVAGNAIFSKTDRKAAIEAILKGCK